VSVTNVRALLGEIEQQLASAEKLDAESRADARREARWLVSAMLDCAPGELAARLDRPLPFTAADRIRAAAARRASGEPMAYAVGTAPFRHLVLHVDARVLIPRPETEIVVEEALRAGAERPGGVAVDIGTGSGAIALALATEGQFERVIATDISADALAVARANAERIAPSVPVEFRQGADLAPLDLQARVIVSNPPYIAYEEAAGLPASVRDWEPATALFAADGGMACYAVLLAQAASSLEPAGWLVLEVDARRAAETAELARRLGWQDGRLVRDLSGRERVLVVRRPSSAAPSFSPGPEARTHA
jgi:release factor glutamine methyltransferase